VGIDALSIAHEGLKLGCAGHVTKFLEPLRFDLTNPLAGHAEASDASGGLMNTQNSRVDAS